MILTLIDNEIRIFTYIGEHPGCYLRQIKTDVGLAMGTTQYHLNQLIRAKKITSMRKGLRKFYFVSGVLYGPGGVNIIQVLSQETAREILFYIIEKKNPTQSDLIKRLGITGASTSWHIKRLLTLNLISESRTGKFKRYSLAADPEVVVKIVRSFNPGILEKWSSRLTDISLSFEELHRSDST